MRIFEFSAVRFFTHAGITATATNTTTTTSSTTASATNATTSIIFTTTTTVIECLAGFGYDWGGFYFLQNRMNYSEHHKVT